MSPQKVSTEERERAMGNFSPASPEWENHACVQVSPRATFRSRKTFPQKFPPQTWISARAIDLFITECIVLVQSRDNLRVPLHHSQRLERYPARKFSGPAKVYRKCEWTPRPVSTLLARHKRSIPLP